MGMLEAVAKLPLVRLGDQVDAYNRLIPWFRPAHRGLFRFTVVLGATAGLGVFHRTDDGESSSAISVEGAHELKAGVGYSVSVAVDPALEYTLAATLATNIRYFVGEVVRGSLS